MRLYENIVIVAPEVANEEETDLMKRMQGYMERLGAELVKLDDWGVRKLAYPIKGKDKGHYYFFLLNMDEGAVAGLDKYYRTMDPILRHMFVVTDEKATTLEKPPEQVTFAEAESSESP
ncbi:MAG: rpsF [Deltaproteobacteria bacterium]|nr:rpsF [Deltaproteobacteria bacterium]